MKDDFGYRFKSLRMATGKTQEEMLKEFNQKYYYNFTPSAISQYENGKRKPEIEALKAFADYFGVTVDYLLCKSNYRHELPVEMQDLRSKIELLQPYVPMIKKMRLNNIDIRTVEAYVDMLIKLQNEKGE